jgi:SCP-2 sterol transfer family
MHFLRECYRRDTARGGQRFARHGLSESAAGFHLPIRVAADPATPLYLIPIDTLVQTIAAHLSVALPPLTTLQLSGRAYPLGSLRDAFCEVMRITGPTLVAPGDFERAPRNPVEEHFFRITRSYRPYLLNAPRFAAPPDAQEALDLAALTDDFLTQMKAAAPAPVGVMAVDLQGITRARDYFDGLTRNDIGRHFLDRHRFVDAAIRFRIHGDADFDEIVVFKDGRARYAETCAAHGFHCGFELDEALFLEVISGQTDLQSAFFAGRVLIEGDEETALKFGSLLSRYYRNFDDNVIQEISV